MSSEAYEIIALLMRYVFVFIGGLIVWRAFRWLRRDARAYRREMKALPDAGLVGEMVNLRTDRAQPLPREGLIGSSRMCDIRVKGNGVLRRHARFEFEEGKGLRVVPARGAKVLLGDREVKGQGYALHGTQLQLGDAALRVRLFAGLNVPHPAPFQPEEAEEDAAFEDATPRNMAAPVPGFPGLNSVSPMMDPADDDEPEGEPSPGAYDGHYTEDGQMTWRYAYSLDELRRAMDRQNAKASAADTDEADDGPDSIPYQSPVAGRRRRRDRHG